jgi:hypothetical protein
MSSSRENRELFQAMISNMYTGAGTMRLLISRIDTHQTQAVIQPRYVPYPPGPAIDACILHISQWFGKNRVSLAWPFEKEKTLFRPSREQGVVTATAGLPTASLVSPKWATEDARKRPEWSIGGKAGGALSG